MVSIETTLTLMISFAMLVVAIINTKNSRPYAKRLNGYLKIKLS